MIIKTTISIIIAFIIPFLILAVIVSETTDNDKAMYEDFFSEFESEKELIVIVGSSHIGQLNTTLINNEISTKFPNKEVLNLGKSGDTPNNRIQHFEKIIDLEPEIVLYGISFRDFDIDTEQPLLDPKWMFDDFILNIFGESRTLGKITKLNPNGLTRDIFRDVVLNKEVDNNLEEIKFEHTPFYGFRAQQFMIINDTEILKLTKNDVEKTSFQFHPILLNREIMDFKSMIQKLETNDIKVIIFTTPVHKYYLEQISIDTKKDFLKIIDELEKSLQTEIYDLTYKYSNEKIWLDNDHVALHHLSKAYSEDIVEIILNEIKE